MLGFDHFCSLLLFNIFGFLDNCPIRAGISGWRTINLNNEVWLRECTEEAHKQRNNGIKDKPNIVDDLSGFCATNVIETPRSRCLKQYNIGGEVQFDRTDDQIENDVDHCDSDRPLSSAQPGVLGLGINNEISIEHCNHEQGNL